MGGRIVPLILGLGGLALLLCGCGEIPFKTDLKSAVIAAHTAAAPEITPAGGAYDTDQSVSISCATDGAVIHYTLDGTDPTSDSAVYEEPLAIAGAAAETTTVTLKAIAVASGLLDSAVSSQEYAITYTWHKVTDAAGWSARGDFQALVHDGKMYVCFGRNTAGAQLNDVYSSTDGATWTQVKANSGSSPPMRRYHAALSFNGALWIMGGNSVGFTFDDEWYSSDGATWTDSTWTLPTTRMQFPVAAFNGAIWMLGGVKYEGSNVNYNDVYSSTNGTSWTMVTPGASWSARCGHAAVVYENKLWVLGGNQKNSTTALNDVYCSSDGSTWTTVTANAAWSGRAEHTAVVYGSKMWVIGGQVHVGSCNNEVWYSSDGASWTRLAVPSDFPVRSGHGCVVYGNRIWVMGGRTEADNDSYVSDVWYYGP